MPKLHTSFVIAIVLSLLAPSHARLPLSPEDLAPSPLTEPLSDFIPMDFPVNSQRTQSDIIAVDDLELVITHKLSFSSVNRYNHHQMHISMKQQQAWSRFPPRHGKHLVGPREVPYGDDIIDMILGDEKRSGEMVLSENFGRTFDQRDMMKPQENVVEDQDAEEDDDDKDELYKEALKVEEEADREEFYEEALKVDEQEDLDKPDGSLTPHDEMIQKYGVQGQVPNACKL